MKFRNYLFLLFAAVALGAAAKAPKYIFYYIGDGMGMGPVMAAQNYNRNILGNDKPLNMMQFPVVGWSQTWSANSDITDSAAAGTALSTGSKTKNSMLGMNADTVAVTSVAKILFDEGYGVAVATSVAPDDATPGAFYTHVPNRGMLYEIGCDMAASGYQFVAGAGLRGTMTDGKPNDLLDRFAAECVQIVRGPEGIDAISSDRVLVLNPEGGSDHNIGYTIDSIAGALTLPMIARAALTQLERTSPDKFFMMIEGGNIDHALHGNDGGAAIKEILNFDQALGVAFDFYRQHPDETLIIVTADHDTGGMAIVKERGGKGGLANIDYQKVSKEEFSNFCKAMLKTRNIFTWNDMKEYLSENLGFFTHIPVSEKAEARLKKLFDDTFELRNTADQKTLYANFNAFAVEVFNMFNDASGLAFTTTSHSGNVVPVFAVGCGADALKGFNNNTDIPVAILKAVRK